MTDTRTTGARSRVLLLLLSALLLAAPLVLVPPVPASAHEDVHAEIVRISPVVVGPDDTQEVALRVTNDTDAELTGLTAELGVGWRPVTTRAGVASWAAGESGLAATQLREPLDPVPPGESVQTTLSLDVRALRLGEAAPWGPRQMSVRVADGSTTLELLHSFLLYDPGTGAASSDQAPPPPVSLTVAAPVTGPVFDPAAPEDYADTVVDRSAPGARYDRLLAAATSPVGALSLAVDPAVVAAAEQSSDDDATAWADRLRRSGGPGVVTLPVGDPDLAALTHAGTGASTVAEIAEGGGALPESWSPADDWGPRVAWPAGALDAPTLGTAARAGAGAVVAAEGATLPDDAVGGVGAATAAGGQVPVAAADPVLGAVLGSATGSGRSVDEPAATVQQLLADTAVLAADAAATGGATAVVAALPRGWSPDVATFDAVLGPLAEQSWVEVVDLTAALADPAAEDVPAEAADEAVAEAELAPGVVRDLVAASDDVAAFATVAADPDELTAGVDRDLFAPMSVAYRDDVEARTVAVGLAEDRARQVQSGISVLDRADVLLISDAGDLPVRVRNELPVDARVTVRLRPDDPRLVVETVPEIVVPAGESRDAQVRVRAIGSGDVTLDVEVTAPSGVEVTAPTEFALSVRAGWETVGTAVIAAGVGLLFLTGIWRTVRRGRSDRRTTGEQVAESAVPTDRPRTVPSQDASPEDTES
ncbi:DUF6049 family protein [Isoptericola sp. AK164]|uniref:DUF6049 family protein n=1 Tax=Isoptericola sp. AK164 TaxID=3024246 RepID=UPI002418A548|nr:DUF6049 family protein [Isoptericola sp. AK164]